MLYDSGEGLAQPNFAVDEKGAHLLAVTETFVVKVTALKGFQLPKNEIGLQFLAILLLHLTGKAD